MKLRLADALKVLASYLVAGAAYLLYFAWPHYEGHAHVPFSAFPEFLVWAPIAPLFMCEALIEKRGGAVVGLLVFGTVLASGLWLSFAEFWRRRSSASK